MGAEYVIGVLVVVALLIAAYIIRGWPGVGAAVFAGMALVAVAGPPSGRSK